MTARPRFLCCVEGCKHTRQRRHAVCDRCFGLLRRRAPDVLNAMSAAHKACKPTERNKHGALAGKLLGTVGGGVVAAITQPWAERADLR